MKLNFNVLVNQVKIAGNSGNIENFNTQRHLSRQTSFADNTDDCLKILHLLSKQEIRAHNKKSQKKMSNNSEDDKESLLIQSFFV